MNRYDRGFTMFFWFVVFMIIVTGAVRLGLATSGNSSVSVGINGFTEMRCVRGYLFTIDGNGTARQVLDEFGKGAKC